MNMKTTVTIEEIVSTVTHDDRYDDVLLPADVSLVIGIALRKLGLTAFVEPFRIDLGNGEFLTFQIETSASKMPFSVQELRPEVLAFALLMEARLRDKDTGRSHCSWKALDQSSLMVPVLSKTFLLEKAVGCASTDPARNDLVKHAVDLANYSMMIADVAGGLDEPADAGLHP